ncbi:hypothetical protein LTR08_007444 [Meristemomyces frigidus]|nr:hypothetical protein LTR08_007444 [Meristemomyces frigidus]
MQINMLALLHEQLRFYTTELGRTHQALSKLYRKLAKIERVLAEREERVLSRKDKKKLQWARSMAKSTVEKLEAQQGWLHEYLRQCNNLIASYETSSPVESSVYHLPATPWTAHLPPSPYGHSFSPYSPIASNPWTHATPARSPACVDGERAQQRPQYWDLSMLRERRQSSPDAASADSGFYEPAMYGQPFHLGHEGFSDPNHVYAHEMMSPGSTYSSATNAAGASTLSTPVTPATEMSPGSEKADDVPELLSSPIRPTKLGVAEDTGAGASGHRRRYSENAIQLIENRLATPQSHQHKRGTSVGPSNCRQDREGVDGDRGRYVAASEAQG